MTIIEQLLFAHRFAARPRTGPGVVEPIGCESPLSNLMQAKTSETQGRQRIDAPTAALGAAFFQHSFKCAAYAIEQEVVASMLPTEMFGPGASP